MNGIVCYRGGRYAFFKDSKSFKPNKVDFILLELRSCLFGKAYLKIPPTMYQELRKMFNIRFSYSFLDGPLMDDEEYPDPWIYHTYRYDDAGKLFTKLIEIVLSEDVLNDTQWVMDCFQIYCFDYLRVKFETKKLRMVYNDFSKFYKDIGYNIPMNFKSFIHFGKRKYREDDSKKPIGKEFTLMQYNNNIYFAVNKKFLKNVKSADVKTKVVTYDNADGKAWEIYEEEKFDFNWSFKDDKRLMNLLKPRFCPVVTEQLESNTDNIYFKVYNKVKKVNDKKVKGVDLPKLIHKYIPDIPYEEDDV